MSNKLVIITAKDLKEATARGLGPLANAKDDEPVFLLRAQDTHAADLVEKWSIWASVADVSQDKAAQAREIEAQMRRWPIKKNPD